MRSFGFLVSSTVLAAGAVAFPQCAAAQSAPVQTVPAQPPAPATTGQDGTTITAPDTQLTSSNNVQNAATPTDAVGDIIVTAQRRDQSLSRTPVSVAVISAERLAQANIVSEQDLRVATPGLSIRSGLNSNQQNFALRGQSQDPYSGTRPGVLPYFNEVQIGGSGGSSAFYDLASVQVLKGPQGTLFGRSATGGAILFTSAVPTEDTSGYISVLGGNYRHFKAEGALSGAIDRNGSVLVRVAFVHQSRRGFQTNLFDGSSVGELNRTGVRGSLTTKLSSALTNDLVVDYYRAGGENMAGVINGLLPLAAPGQPPYVPAQLLYSGTATPVDRATGIGTVQAFLSASGAPPAALAAVPAFYDAYFAARGSQGLSARLASQLARGPYTVDYNGPNMYRARNLIVTNRTSLDLGGGLTLRNIFGYTRLNQATATDADGTRFGLSESTANGEILDRTRQLSNELQLQGKVADDRLNFVTGLFYSKERNAHFQNSTFFDILLGPQFQDNFYTIRNRTYAGYGQGTFNVTPKLAFTLGARYTSERVSKETLPGDTFRTALGNPPPPGFSYFKSDTYNRLSWQAGVQYQATSQLLFYTQARRAYKSGGFNGQLSPRVGNAAQGGDAYGAERLTDAEVGAKFNGLVGSMPVRFSVDYFRNWIRDSQRVGFGLVGGGPAALTINVPKGTTDGIELEGNIRPASWLTVGGNFNYTKARFSNQPGSIGISFTPTAPVVAVPVVYDQVTDTPRYTSAIYGDVAVPLGGGIKGLLHADYYHQSKTFSAPRSANNAGTVFDGYGLVTLRAGIESGQGWSLIANVRNVGNKTYFVGGLPAGEIYQVNVAVPGEPRTFTLEARFRF